MPHIIIKNKEIKKEAFQLKGASFGFYAKRYNAHKDLRDEYKVCVNNENKDFLLTVKEKNGNLLLKADKVTRVTPVTIVKDALNKFAEGIEADIISFNTNNHEQKLEPKKEYLKDIDYFVNEFDTDKEIRIEVGFGSGRHLIHQAKLNPDVQFIGIEIHTPSIEQMLKQVQIEGLTNVLALNYDARLFMEFIKSNSVGKIYVHFPVPWDKKPHRRVYSNDFINEALRVLKVDGNLELRTDSRKYFDYCVELLTNLPTGRITIDINKELAVSSKYEDRWKKMGKNIYDVVLTCNQEDEQIVIEKDFSFDIDIDFEKFKDNYSTKPYVGDNYMVHIEGVYTISENSGLIEVAFGSFNRPVNKYILVQDNKATYFQRNPIPTSANIKAHKKLLEILKND